MTATQNGSGCARTLLIDDHPLFRDALRALLTRQSDFGVCGEAGTLSEARRACDELNPDLLILDLDLPDGDGLDLLQESKEWANPPRALVVTVKGEDDPAAIEAMRLGASGFLSKRADAEQILAAARAAAAGKPYLSDGLIDRLLRRRN